MQIDTILQLFETHFRIDQTVALRLFENSKELEIQCAKHVAGTYDEVTVKVSDIYQRDGDVVDIPKDFVLELLFSTRLFQQHMFDLKFNVASSRQLGSLVFTLNPQSPPLVKRAKPAGIAW